MNPLSGESISRGARVRIYNKATLFIKIKLICYEANFLIRNYKGGNEKKTCYQNSIYIYTCKIYILKSGPKVVHFFDESDFFK